METESESGWKQFSSSFETSKCDVERVEWNEVSLPEKFAEERKEPVVLTRLPKSTRFHERCKRSAILEQYGERKIILSSANTHSYEKKTKTVREYVEKYLEPTSTFAKADKTWYWFGDNDHDAFGDFFPSYEKESVLVQRFVPPSTLVAYSFGIGGPFSGVPLHIHGPGWSETIVGRKRWYLSRPEHEPLFNGNETALRWAKCFQSNGNRARFKQKIVSSAETNRGKKDVKKILSCIVNEGEAIYFPDRWWHATLNLDESVFMSSFVNYARKGDQEGEQWQQQHDDLL